MSFKFTRVLKILRVAIQYGLDEIAISGLKIPRIAKLIVTLIFWRDISAPRGERLRRALEDLGPIFVKFGQVLSTRRDLMPPDIADELARLQDRVPPFDSDLAIVASIAIANSSARLNALTKRGTIIGTMAFMGVFISIPIKLKKFISNTKSNFYKSFYKGFFVSFIVFMFMNMIDNFFSAPKVITFFWILIAVTQSLTYNCTEL